MRKKVVMLSLLSLSIVGCAAGGDADASSSPDVSNQSGASSSSDDSKADEKDGLLKEIRMGFDAFLKKDCDISYDCKDEFSYVMGENEMSAHYAGKGTISRSNGYLYAIETSFAPDETTGAEVETLDGLQYVGLVGGEYRHYYASNSEKTYFLADKYAAEYLYDEDISPHFYSPVEGIWQHLENAPTFSALLNSLRYTFTGEISDMTCDVYKKGEVTTLTFGAKQHQIGDSYDTMSLNYEFNVKDAYIETLSYTMDMESIYPSGNKISQTRTSKYVIERRFDNEFYSSFESDSSYTADSNGMQALVDIYYGDYFYDDFSCYVGSDIDAGALRSNYFDGFYYDKECTVPVSSKKFSSDVRKIYVKLRETTTDDHALIYVLTDTTTVYLNDILPSHTEKMLKVWGPSSSSYNLPWVQKSETSRNASLETMAVNGVATTDDSISIEMGKAYLVEHAYSTFREP